jgi:SAM-dependent methyltransferase
MGAATHEQNRLAWDDRVRNGKTHTRPITPEDLANARQLIDECGWLPPKLKGTRVLCLAAGGGRHGPLFASLGAEVTVVDISQGMLDLDRRVAAEHKLRLAVVQTSMDDLSMLAGASFEIVIQPVSTCYVPDLGRTYREIARVTADRGLYVSQHKQPASLQASALPGTGGYTMTSPYYRTTPLSAEIDGLKHREAGTVEFIHRWEELVGGLCRSGFVIEDLVEPRHADATASPGTFGHRSHYLPPYVTIKARRRSEERPGGSRLWTPSER